MKPMKYSKSLLLLVMILPWFTVPILGKDAFKRFLPAGLFILIVLLIVNFIAKKRIWWWWDETLSPKMSGVIPFMWGPFLDCGHVPLIEFSFLLGISYVFEDISCKSLLTLLKMINF